MLTESIANYLDYDTWLYQSADRKFSCFAYVSQM